jgi:glutamyl-Q tRNA(Asp) synthetase
MEHFNYRGRFAPSPTGPLHFGSLIAALGSHLDAKHHGGSWLLRMEDLDTPRCLPGAADDILRTLEACSLPWDDEVIYQSRRTAAYEQALHELQRLGAIYPCCCTRKEIADSALYGIDGQIYPGTCRHGIPSGRAARARRARTDDAPLAFDDALQGRIVQRLQSEIGDFVVKRADGLFAYQLAVVVDDAFQHITHVVRGADLLASTQRQIYLQHLLGLPTPHYMHLPVALNAAGEKLSKQTLAAPVDPANPAAALWHALAFLQQQPPQELQRETPEIIRHWAIQNWRRENLYGIAALPADYSTTGTRAASAHSNS